MADADTRGRLVRFSAQVVWIERRTTGWAWLDVIRELIDWLQGARMLVHLCSHCTVSGSMPEPDQIATLWPGKPFLREVELPREVEGTVAGYFALESAIRSDFMDDLVSASALRN